MSSHQKTRDARAFIPYLTGTANGQYPPCTLTVCAHLLSSSPHLQRTRPASSLLRRGKEEEKKRQKGATSRTFPCHISSSQHFPVIIARFQTPDPGSRLQAPEYFSLSSQLVSIHLVNLTTCHPSGHFQISLQPSRGKHHHGDIPNLDLPGSYRTCQPSLSAWWPNVHHLS